MVTNLHERKFKTTKNSSVNQKTKFWGNLRVNFQCEGQLKFFDVVGSFFSRALDLLLTLEENSCFELFTGDYFHTNCPCVWPSTPWMSKPVRIFIIPVVQWGYSTSTFWFFSNLRFFLKYWSGSILYIGRLCLASDKTLYICFHVPRRWFRNEEMRSAEEGRLKEYNKPPMRTKWEGKQTLFLILGYK